MELRKLKMVDYLHKHIIEGGRHRLSICKGCPVMKLTRGIGMTCGELGNEIPNVQCGCVLKIKAYLPMFGCPQKKW